MRGHRLHQQLLRRQVAEVGWQDWIEIAQALLDVADQLPAAGVAVLIQVARVLAQLFDAGGHAALAQAQLLQAVIHRCVQPRYFAQADLVNGIGVQVGTGIPTQGGIVVGLALGQCPHAVVAGMGRQRGLHVVEQALIPRVHRVSHRSGGLRDQFSAPGRRDGRHLVQLALQGLHPQAVLRRRFQQGTVLVGRAFQRNRRRHHAL
ncbi:hypothetical protein D3C71_1473660 [compost metagenome]